VRPLDLDYIVGLYRTHGAALRQAREAQRRLYAQRGDARLERYAPVRLFATTLRRIGLPPHYRRLFKPKFDDIEAEITYLLVRDRRPQAVVEIAPYYGWSTTWILQALEDNGTGRLHSYDLVDYALRTVPRTLAGERWRFTLGDVRRHQDRLPPAIEHVFIDAEHTAEFAQWYTAELFPRLAPGTTVSVHDVFHRQDPGRFTEGPVLVSWLERRAIPYFTAAPPRSPEAFDAISAVKQELGLHEQIHPSRANPAVFFRIA
jgi:predicted O-methyltransferase YrrM